MAWTADHLDHIESFPVSAVRKDIARFLDRASKLGERVGVTNHGAPVAGLVPFSDIATLEAMDARAVAEADAMESGDDSARVVLRGSPDRYVSYVVGLIAARLADAQVVKDPEAFAEIQQIIEHGIRQSLDASSLPSPPAEYMDSTIADEMDAAPDPEPDEDTSLGLAAAAG